MFSSFVQSQPKDLNVGDIAPEIRLPNPQGDTISLSSYRGKLVLIDFWATWCAPCVKDQVKLKELYEKFKDRTFTIGNGFEIFGVSLDSKLKPWVNAIKKNKITWTQVSDLKFWMSPVAKIYNIQELPSNVLIDSEGKIIALNIFGDDLFKFLEGLVKITQ